MSPARGERSLLVPRVQFQGVLFRPYRGWRVGGQGPHSLARWATIWRPCRGFISAGSFHTFASRTHAAFYTNGFRYTDS